MILQSQLYLLNMCMTLKNSKYFPVKSDGFMQTLCLGNNDRKVWLHEPSESL